MAKRIEKEETFHSGGGCYTSMGKLTNGEWFIADMTDISTGIDIYKDEDGFNRRLDGWMFGEDSARHLESTDDEARELWEEIFQIEEEGIRDRSRVKNYLARNAMEFLMECKQDYEDYVEQEEDDDDE